MAVQAVFGCPPNDLKLQDWSSILEESHVERRLLDGTFGRHGMLSTFLGLDTAAIFSA